MTKLQQRKDAIAKEMREIEILEKMENERNSESEKIKLISRLLLDLHDQPLACGLPIGTVAHVKMIFDASCETCTTCYFADTCEEIVSLTSKGRRKNTRKKGSNGSNNGRVSTTVPYKRVISTGTITLEGNEGRKNLTFTGNDWKVVTKEIRDYFKANPITGLTLEETVGKIAGYTHKGSAAKNYPALEKFNG